MIVDQTRQLSHQLRLFGIHESLERRSQEAISNNLDHLEYLRLVLDDEVLQRKNAAAKRLVTRAKFRTRTGIEDWDQSFDRGISKARFKDLSMLNFFHNKENLIILGKTGEGKTHLAQALGHRLCQEGISTSFHSVNLFFEEVIAERASGRYLNFIKKLNRNSVLLLDDFALRAYTHAEANVLMDILEERYQKGIVIMTSQVDPRGWIKLFEDPVIGEAIVDRLTKPSMKLTIKGGSYRDKLNGSK